MLEKIEYIFPKNIKNIELFNLLSTLFRDIKYATIFKESEIHIISSNLRPETVFKLDDNIDNIQLNIGNKKYSNFLNRKLEYIEYNNESNEAIKLSIKDVSTLPSGLASR